MSDTDAEGTLLEREPRGLAPHVQQNAELVDNTLAQARTRILRRLFPGEMERLVQSHELTQLKTGFEFRRRALQMAVETKLQAVEEMCNHVLVTGKSEIRRERQEFFAGQSLRLQGAMNDCADSFNRELEQRFQRLENLKNDYLRRKEEERLLRIVDQFHGMLEELASEFIGIIHEGVKR